MRVMYQHSLHTLRAATAAMSASFNGVEIRDVEGRGKGLVALRDIRAGETVLTALPIFIVCNHAEQYCCNCLRDLSLSGKVAQWPCPGCQKAAFCSQLCAERGTSNPATHTTDICRVLSKADMAGLTEEDALSLKLLIQAQALLAACRAATSDHIKAAAEQAWQSFAGLQSGKAATHGQSASGLQEQQRNHMLHQLLQRASAAAGVPCTMSLEDVAGVTSREVINGYGIMARSGPVGERRIRGTAIYSAASYINHECLPNVARVDDFDSRTLSYPESTAAHFKALHDLPAGEEITQSYFPLNVGYRERQQRLQEEYGFACTCPRCKEEATWFSDNEHEMGDEAAETQSLASDQEMDTDTGKADEAYIGMFLLKYVCPKEDCFGTMIPLEGVSSYKCNMCGLQRTEEEFMAAVEQDEE